MVDYNAMSDFEINKLVAEKLGRAICEEQYEEYNDRDENVVLLWSEIKREVDTVDYCNNPSDAWQIIVNNLIAFHAWNNPYLDHEKRTVWNSYVSNQQDIEFHDKKPLRAAMIVFLMMNENNTGKGG